MKNNISEENCNLSESLLNARYLEAKILNFDSILQDWTIKHGNELDIDYLRMVYRDYFDITSERKYDNRQE